MKFEIERIDTGYLITTEDGKYAYESFADILRMLSDYYDPGSRHDAKRVYIIEAPGDKHPDFTEEIANVIWRDNV